jgi:HSP20 family molecular chaperone IbpA
VISLLRKSSWRDRADRRHRVSAFDHLTGADRDGRHSHVERVALHETDEGLHVSLTQTTTHYVMCVEPNAPGIGLRVQLAGDLLTIRGHRYRRADPDDEPPHGVEWREDCFSRSFSLPPDARREAVRWEFQRGILIVTVARKPAESARH